MNKVRIGDADIAFPVGLAPLAGVSDRTFRRICREMGAGLAVSEMVSAQAINYGNRNTAELLKTFEEERPVAIQLFGSSPEAVSEAGRRIEGLPFDFFDFNMGCPVPKVVKNGEGSALMKNPALAGEIIAALAGAVKKPVTVKIRSGFDSDHINACEMAEILEQAGASAITVHARTREQFYTGKADWTVIRRVKETVSIPVFGNGDVTDGPSAKRMLDETGCDGILVGRAAMGNPWIFREIAHFLETGESLPKPSGAEIGRMILNHARKLCEDKGEYLAMRQMRTHAAWYSAGLPFAARFRREASQVETFAALEQLVKDNIIGNNIS